MAFFEVCSSTLISITLLTQLCSSKRWPLHLDLPLLRDDDFADDFSCNRVSRLKSSEHISRYRSSWLKSTGSTSSAYYWSCMHEFRALTPEDLVHVAGIGQTRKTVLLLSWSCTHNGVKSTAIACSVFAIASITPHLSASIKLSPKH